MRRRSSAGLKRIGLLAIVLVVALGSLGVGYAIWSENLYINSIVYTGNLDIDIAGCSSTFVYKVPLAPDIGYGPETVVHYVPSGSTDPTPPAGGTLIASAVTEYFDNMDADSATMTFEGLFPCIDFQADLELEYVGTIPARVSVAEITPDDFNDTILTALWALGESSGHTYGAWIDGELSVNDGATWEEIDDPLGLQLHQNDLAHLTLHVHLPEGGQYDGLSGLGFTGLITVVQWNLYEEED